mmetsp:Transcript_11846/g.18182  ORF Transcript_11846/g.18182 Transcript_11846/m.18182 type:complete len:179 (+) Transcript_11846:273-809(+)|eukprot:CAMPEP_0178913954 /NCGR_PEP_ID=MMETSP0786-20121207/11138_1 /TAXON_ID=186022 /ORGANISM="Thalassionema frauenfeldii, Strain CCMP 1798" /LENGTH=178 /DNA_ID=CAMNT_0020586771 /DNA_START=156 /DNA_END=692 /DNA_ORIENTATION=-
MKLVQKDQPVLLQHDDCDNQSVASGEIIVADTTSKPNRPDRPNKRSVTFFKDVTVREIVHVDDMSDKEKKSTWYTRDDLKRFRVKLYRDVLKLQNGTTKDDKDLTLRGLECRSEEGLKSRRTNICESITAVLDEQDLQYESSCHNEEKIRKIYKEKTYQCEIDAQRVGASDAMEARCI